MARGRKLLIALNEANHIAEKRGEVRYFRHEQDLPLNCFTCRVLVPCNRP
jgi:hypothetical protein